MIKGTIELWGEVDLLKSTNPLKFNGQEISGMFLSYLKECFKVIFNCNFRLTDIKDALILLSKRNKYYPVLDDIETTKWDNVPRIETFFIDYLGAKDTEANRYKAKLFFATAIARLMAFKTKEEIEASHNMLILLGPEVGKTTLLRDTLFLDCVTSNKFRNFNINTKDKFSAITTNWSYSDDELIAFRRTNKEVLKSFLKQNYENLKFSSKPRTCIYTGSTSSRIEISKEEQEYILKVDVGENKPSKSVFNLYEKDVLQLWAEVKVLLEKGFNIFVEPGTKEMKLLKE